MTREDDVSRRVVTAMNRGRAQLNEKKVAAAIAAFDEVIGLLPLYGTAYLDRGGARMMSGDWAGGIADLERAVALLAPGAERAVAYSNRGVAREELRDLVGAIRDLRQSVAGGWEAASEELARIRTRYGTRAVDAEAEAGRPDAAAAARLCDEGRRLLAKQPVDALVRFQRATELCPGEQATWHGLGIVRAALRLAAVTAFDRALACEPQDLGMRAEGLYNRGMMRANLDDIPGAIADLEACLLLCRDDRVGFPAFGDSEKEAIFVEHIERRLGVLRAAATRPGA